MVVVRAVESSNVIIENGQMYIYDQALIEEGKEPVIVTRINKWGVEDCNILEETIDRTWGYTSHTVRFNQIGAREYYHSHYASTGSSVFFSGVVSTGIGFIASTTVGTIMGLWGTSDAAWMTSIGNRVLDASGRGSITVNETIINGNPYRTVGTTIYDCDGNIIGQFNR